MECRALKTFNSERYGFMRAGARFSSELQYANQLRIKGMVEFLPDPLAPERTQAHIQAPRNQAHTDAPLGKGPPSEHPPLDDTAPPADDGEAKPSLSSRVGQALRAKTARRSKAAVKP